MSTKRVATNIKFCASKAVKDGIMSARFSKLFDTVCQNVAAEMVYLDLIIEKDRQKVEQYLSDALYQIECENTIEYLDKFGPKCADRTRSLLDGIANFDKKQHICDILLTRCVWSATIAWFEPASTLRKDRKTGRWVRYRSTKGCLPCLTRTGIQGYTKTLLYLFNCFRVDLKKRHLSLYKKFEKTLNSSKMLDWKNAVVAMLFEMHKIFWIYYSKPNLFDNHDQMIHDDPPNDNMHLFNENINLSVQAQAQVFNISNDEEKQDIVYYDPDYLARFLPPQVSIDLFEDFNSFNQSDQFDTTHIDTSCLTNEFDFRSVPAPFHDPAAYVNWTNGSNVFGMDVDPNLDTENQTHLGNNNMSFLG